MAKKHYQTHRLYRRGTTWYAYISFMSGDGKKILFRGSLGTADRAEAERLVAEKIAATEIYRKNEELPSITIDEAFGEFYERHAKYYARPAETLRKLLLIKSNISVQYLHQIDSSEISDYIQRRKKKVKNGTINRELVILSSLLSNCRLWKYKTSDIKPNKFKLKEPAENIKYLKDWTVAQKIIDRAAAHLQPIIYTALYTGMRRGNILRLKWEELDFANKLINIKVKDRTKDGGKNLSIPMIDKLARILDEQPRINEYVFNYQGHPIESIKRSWHTIFYNPDGTLRDSSLPYTNFHTLRHTAATWILKATGNLKITQEILGHANISTTMKYAHVLGEEKRTALNSVFEN